MHLRRKKLVVLLCLLVLITTTLLLTLLTKSFSGSEKGQKIVFVKTHKCASTTVQVKCEGAKNWTPPHLP